MGTFNASFKENTQLTAGFTKEKQLAAEFGSIQKVSTSNYEELYNLPYINSRQIVGNKTGADYNLQDKMDAATVAEIERILYLDL